jgi:acetyl-CoA C-acetyltransferase
VRRVALAGAGMTPFGELFGRSIKELIPQALGAALGSVDKGIEPEQIEAAWLGELQTTDGFPAGILADSCGLLDVPVTRVENACATGSDALRNAVMAVGGGWYDVAVVVGADKVRETPASSTFWTWMGMMRDSAWDYPPGLIAPASFGLHVARWMHEVGAAREHLAMVAVKNHRHALTNPFAHLRFEVTVEDVLNAPLVVEPFGLLDCTPQSDGAAAVVVVSEDIVDRYTDAPVWIRGFGLGLDRVMHAHKADLTTFPATTRAARRAFRMAGLEPSDIDVAELHDCFTGVELMTYEDLGFCDRGGAAKLIESGETGVGGRLPVNPSGGLKAKGHPPGATGIAQVVEIYQQLRGEAANQTDGARIGLCHNVGGPTAVAAVTILEGDR